MPLAASPFTAAQYLVAGLALGAHSLFDHESVLGAAIRGMPAVAAGAGTCAGADCLPPRQEYVPVIVPALSFTPAESPGNRHLGFRDVALLDHILVAFQAVRIRYRKG